MGKYNDDSTGYRFINGRKQEALTQIEGWVGGSRDEIIKAGAAKVASHPPKNITEQKMLDSHLYDMSRQRFNFIMQCQWERKLFLEKQKRKTAVMRDLLRNVDLTNISENPFASRRSTAPADGGKQLQNCGKWKGNTPHSLYARSVVHQSPSLEADVFVTHKYPRSIDRRPNMSEISNQLNFSLRTQTATTTESEQTVEKKKITRPWPMNDARYTRLSEVLSETYPKVPYAITRRKNVEKL